MTGDRESRLLRIEAKLNEQVKQYAHDRHMSANAAVCELVHAGLTVQRGSLHRGLQVLNELLIGESDPTAALALHRAVRTLVKLTEEESEPASAATEPAPCALKSPGRTGQC